LTERLAAFTWSLVGNVRSADQYRDTFHDDALDGAAAVQSSFNRNFELAYRSTYGQMRHVFFNQASGWWEDGTLFGPVNPIGIAGFVQSNRVLLVTSKPSSLTAAGSPTAGPNTTASRGPWPAPRR